MPSIISEHEQHIDSGGKPIVNGTIHIGARNTDPTLLANKITIYSDRALSTPLANPQSTDAEGRSVNKIWVPGRYSIVVQDSESAQQYSELDAGENPETGISALTNIQGTNTITADGDPTIDTLLDQQAYIFRAAGGNTGAVTLQIDLTAAKAIKKQHDVALVSGDIEANQTIYVVYNELDDTFELINQPIVLSATDFNVSNDLTVGNNAIITGDVDAATGTIDTFDAATGTIDTFDATTIESPTITKSTVPVYGLVVLDTPETLLTTASPATTATAVNSTTLNTATASKAILRVYIDHTSGTTVAIGNSASITIVDHGCARSQTGDYNDIVTNLDASYDFFYMCQVGTLTGGLVIKLIGYYV